MNRLSWRLLSCLDCQTLPCTSAEMLVEELHNDFPGLLAFRHSRVDERLRKGAMGSAFPDMQFRFDTEIDQQRLGTDGSGTAKISKETRRVGKEWVRTCRSRGG